MPVDEMVRAVSEWYLRNARDLPWRAEGFGAWGVLVSEVMLQQTPVARVIEPLAAWLERWPTPADLAAVPAGDAVRAWGRLGYPRRALRLHACAVALVDNHGGVVPRDVDELLALPGIGAYTARAVAAFAYGDRHPVVDTNVRRVVARAIHGRAAPRSPSPRRDHADVERLLPESPHDAAVASAALMELGAIVCTASAPRCHECPIAALCAWRGQGYPEYDGPERATRPRYEGSDRHVRGLILAALRDHDTPISTGLIEQLWPDRAQRERAVASLLGDGLIERDAAGGYRLPE